MPYNRSMELSSLIAEARKQGWAEGSATMLEMRHEANWLGMQEAPNRTGGSAVTRLRPLSPDMAKPNSLSAQYGRGNQPLHSDGAHLSRPPDVVILVCEGTSQVPTRLWSLSRGGWTKRGLLTNGVFLVSSGRESFFCTALERRGLRFDPGCMIPCDARAREVVRYFGEAAQEADAFEWDRPNKVLVIDNNKTLHARAAAEAEPEREIQRVCLYLKEAP